MCRLNHVQVIEVFILQLFFILWAYALGSLLIFQPHRGLTARRSRMQRSVAFPLLEEETSVELNMWWNMTPDVTKTHLSKDITKNVRSVWHMHWSLLIKHEWIYLYKSLGHMLLCWIQQILFCSLECGAVWDYYLIANHSSDDST